MADNTILNIGTGGDVIASDDIAGVKYQRVKATFGVDAVATDVSATNPMPVVQPPASLIVTGTAATGVTLTITLPAVAAQFHYITRINLVKYATAAVAGTATPVIVTTTNLPGSLAYTMPTAQAIGTVYETDVEPTNSLRSSVVNTATTIVCPVATTIIWRATVYYYTAA